jgi:PAS domain S-box-containing protein
MNGRADRLGQLVAQSLVGNGVLALAMFVGYQLQISETAAAFIGLFVVVVVSLWANLIPALSVAVAATVSFDYFFTAPLFRFRIEQPIDLVAVVTFGTTALVVTRLKDAAHRSYLQVQSLKNELELVVDTIPALTWSALPDGSRDFVSRRWTEYTGMPSSDGFGTGWMANVHADDRASYLEHWNAAVATGDPLAVEARLRRFDGVYEWFLIRAVPFRDVRGDIIRWYGTATAIEDRKRAERILAEEKGVLESIVQGVAMPVLLDRLCRLVEDVSRPRLASIHLLDTAGTRLIHAAAPSLPKVFVAALDGVAIGPAAGSLGTAAVRKGPVLVSDIATDPLWAEAREVPLSQGLRACWSTPILSSDRRVLGTLAIYAGEPWTPGEDERALVERITHLSSIAIERRQAEERLESQVRLLDLTHDTIFVRDEKDMVTFWNRGAEELYGWTRAEAIGQITHDLLKTAFPIPLPEITAQLLATGRWEGDVVHTTRAGAQLTVASRWSLQSDPAGPSLRVLETNTDITSRRHAEEVARKAQEELAHAARVATMGELAASIAHEVNQPLSGVVINANACLRWLASQSPNLDEARDALQRIIRDGKRASDVITRVRALSRKSAAERESLDLNDAIRSVVTIIQGELRKNRVVLTLNLAPDLPAVLGDRVQMQQVILNLAINAIEALSGVVGRQRELVIRTEREDEHVRVSVRDSGSGLAPDAMGRIFDAFYTTKHTGLGMGLSISRSIVESHGGTLSVALNEGPGTTFHFTI